jgi:hypothetical protein
VRVLRERAVAHGRRGLDRIAGTKTMVGACCCGAHRVNAFQARPAVMRHGSDEGAARRNALTLRRRVSSIVRAVALCVRASAIPVGGRCADVVVEVSAVCLAGMTRMIWLCG